MHQNYSSHTPEHASAETLSSLRQSASYGLISWIFTSFLDCARGARRLASLMSGSLNLKIRRSAG